MRLDKKLKKKLLLNAPYVLFVYLFDKAAQGIRLAPGTDASQKLLHLADGFGSAFASPLPSFHPIDLLIGIAGAVIMWVVVYVRGKTPRSSARTRNTAPPAGERRRTLNRIWTRTSGTTSF